MTTIVERTMSELKTRYGDNVGHHYTFDHNLLWMADAYDEEFKASKTNPSKLCEIEAVARQYEADPNNEHSWLECIVLEEVARRRAN